jgi:hypothetical protein
MHIDEQTAIKGHDESAARLVHIVAADNPLRSALENAEDAPFGAASVAAVLDPHDNAIAVHGLIQIGSGNKDARRGVARGLRFDERKPARVGGHATDD